MKALMSSATSAPSNTLCRGSSGEQPWGVMLIDILCTLAWKVPVGSIVIEYMCNLIAFQDVTEFRSGRGVTYV